MGQRVVEGGPGLCYHGEAMEINVLIDEEVAGCPGEAWFERVVGEALAAEGVGEAVEVGIVVTGQERIQELNLVHRGIDEPTDVLSFPMTEELTDVEGDDVAGGDVELAEFISPPDGIRHLGEVIVSYPQAVVQASQQGHSARRETSILVVHGVLHLLGYGHDVVADEVVMKSREVDILSKIGNIDQ